MEKGVGVALAPLPGSVAGGLKGVGAGVAASAVGAEVGVGVESRSGGKDDAGGVGDGVATMARDVVDWHPTRDNATARMAKAITRLLQPLGDVLRLIVWLFFRCLHPYKRKADENVSGNAL